MSMPREMQNPLLSSAPERPPVASGEATLSDLPEPEVKKGGSQARRCGFITLSVLLLLILLGAVGVLIALLLLVGGQAPSIMTECGLVEGKYDMAKDVFLFRGIPYAVPPVGERRWALPEPMTRDNGTCWSGILEADKPAPSCSQILPHVGYTGSEDCLYLDVITPSIEVTANLPVYVYIHGGYLRFGDMKMDGYCPNEEIARNVKSVFVSIQYRLGPFGFMTLDALGPHSNFGLWDQRAALQWIQDNIKGFGGNPDQVTVMGASSGGTSIYAMLASPKFTGLFHAAWLMSPSPVLNHTQQQANEANQFFLDKSGCVQDNCTSNDCVRQCLLEVGAENASSWTQSAWSVDMSTDLPKKGLFELPLLVVDGELLPQGPIDAFNDNAPGLPDVPILIGSTAQEIDFEPFPKDLLQWNHLDYERYVKNYFNSFGVNTTEILALYPYTRDAQYSFTTVTSDVRVNCAVQEVANIMAQSGRTVYHYVVTSFPSSPTHAFHSPWLAKYAFHGWDTFAFFQRFSLFLTGRPTDADWQFADSIVSMAQSFAETGTMGDEDWLPMPNHTALVGSSVTMHHAYQPVQCNYFMERGFFPYSWMN